jgi:serine phosphatase RsbU (regulator of sigma subunit)
VTDGANRADSKRLKKGTSGQNPAVGGPVRRPAPGGIPDDVPVAEASSPPESPPPVSGRAPRRAPPEEETMDAMPRFEGAEEEAAAPTEAPAPSPRKKPKARGSAPSRRVRPVEAHDDERGHGGAPFQRGLPLAVKIAAFSAVLVAAVAVGLGYFLLTLAADHVERQINEKGVVAVSEISSFPDPIFWFPPTMYANETDVARERRWKNDRSKRLKEWETKLGRLVQDKTNDVFLDVRITIQPDGKDEPVIAASADGVAVTNAVDVVPIGKAGEVSIGEGNYGGPSYQGRMRRYTRLIEVTPPPIFDKDDPFLTPQQQAQLDKEKREPLSVGYAHVYLKANDIDQVKGAIQSQVVVATGAGIGIAVLFSILVAAFLAAPLRALVSDMHAVAKGDLNHKTIPRSRDEIGQVAAQFNEMTRSLKHAQKSEQEKQAIEHELTIATEIQTKLLPDRIPQIPGYDLYSFYASAKEVGGDYYDFLVIDPTHLGIVVADVSGKGIPGSMVMTMVRSLIRLASHRETSPAETLKKVNRILAKDIRRGMFVTAIYAVLDVQRKVLTVSSAGHNPMVYFCAKTGASRQVNPPGIALGFDKGRTFDENIKEEAIELAPGDRIALYTDGVVEAMNERQEEFGMERFTELVGTSDAASSKELTNLIVQALEEHRGKAEQSDDITITALRVE